MEGERRREEGADRPGPDCPDCPDCKEDPTDHRRLQRDEQRIE
jgi:hypothetical protein